MDTVKPSVPAGYIIHIIKGKLLILMLINSDNSSPVGCYMDLDSGEEYTISIHYTNEKCLKTWLGRKHFLKGHNLPVKSEGLH